MGAPAVAFSVAYVDGSFEPMALDKRQHVVFLWAMSLSVCQCVGEPWSETGEIEKHVETVGATVADHEQLVVSGQFREQFCHTIVESPSVARKYLFIDGSEGGSKQLPVD